VACLDCGKELAYDWKSMRIGETMASSQAPGQIQPSLGLKA
jgi:DNA-directed RNA polymerase subunit N (RpoN/RPB10)